MKTNPQALHSAPAAATEVKSAASRMRPRRNRAQDWTRRLVAIFSSVVPSPAPMFSWTFDIDPFRTIILPVILIFFPFFKYIRPDIPTI